MNNHNFQYCQKIVVFSRDLQSVLLCKRKWENDYDGVFSFIGGKMETTDQSLIDWLRREKDEEVGVNFKIRVYPTFATNFLFHKKSWDAMVLPYYYTEHVEGDVVLNDEYSEYQWVKIDELDRFEPKIPNIPDIVSKLQKLSKISLEEDFIVV